MPNYENDRQYLEIIEQIMANDEFIKEQDMQHHADTRLNHSLKVSYYSYKIAKALRLEYTDVARAGLLHDFYFEQVNDQEKIKDKVLLFTTKHPEIALNNSLKYFELTEKEKDIIRTHMFPVDVKIPRYLESWVVSLVDKAVSTKEMYFKFYNKSKLATNFYILFLLGLFR